MDGGGLWIKAGARIEECDVTQVRQGLSQFRVGARQNRLELVDCLGAGPDGGVFDGLGHA